MKDYEKISMNHVRANGENIFGVQEVMNMKNGGLVDPGPHLRTEMRLKNKNENVWRMNTKEDMKELDEKLPDARFQLGISKPRHHHCWQIFGVNNVNPYPGVKEIGKWIFQKFTLLRFWGNFHFCDFWGNGGGWGNFWYLKG